jgi:hypothetical protein
MKSRLTEARPLDRFNNARTRRGSRDNRIECRADNEARVSRLRPMLQNLSSVKLIRDPIYGSHQGQRSQAPRKQDAL